MSNDERAKHETNGVTVEYLSKLPVSIPADRVFVHNHVLPARRLGTRGFRAWLQAPDPDSLELCACGWASELGTHYRVRQ